MLATQQCYEEGPDADLETWRPATISAADWLARDLNDVERELLVSNFRGYRLLMDDGSNNPSSSIDTADAYNEWFKAAAWNGLVDPPENMTYGFGRSILTGADANYRASGDPFDDNTTPIEFFEPANGNGFGLLDMSGNAYQWLQGRFNGHAASIDFRTIRGGSWNDPATGQTLRTDSRSFTVPTMAHGQIGFRVVRTLARPTGDFTGDGRVSPLDHARLIASFVGPEGTIPPEWTVFDFDADGDIDLRDFAVFQSLYSGDL
jgi:hypothetical protein